MKVFDRGHDYSLKTLDGGYGIRLTIGKRERKKYPGNIGHYSGTTIQEVCRSLIDRIKYVNNQIHDQRNIDNIRHLRSIILSLEHRADERHNRPNVDYPT